jgi:hypothetical protein
MRCGKEGERESSVVWRKADNVSIVSLKMAGMYVRSSFIVFCKPLKKAGRYTAKVFDCEAESCEA